MSGVIIKQLILKYIQKECYCGSGKFFNDCCKKKEAKPLITQEYFNSMTKTSNSSGFIPSGVFLKLWGKVSEGGCLFYKCSNKAINSHLISKNILKKVFSTEKLLTLYIDDSNIFCFKEIGINKIKVFLGWCSEHDNKIFQQIDNNYYNSTEEHIFLYTLRAFGYETRIKQNSLRQAYSLLYYYINNENLFLQFLGIYHGYIDIKNRYSIIEHYFRICKFNKIKFKTFTLKKYNNPLFVSSVFQLNYDLKGKLLNDLNDLSKESVPLAFNIVSTNRTITVIFSCLSKDYKLYEDYLIQINNYYENKYYIFINIINNIIYNYCENVILSNNFIIPSNFKFYSFFETNFKTINFTNKPLINYVE